LPRLKFTYAQKKCVAATGMLMQRTNMVGHGARIGIAASGGVDSFVLAKVLTIRKRIVPFDMELMVLHVNPGFEPESHAPLVDWCREEGLAAHVELTDYGPAAHTEANRKASPCFLCAWNRRKRLFELCRQYGLTHLALGHNTDDLAETFFLNLLQNGRVDGLSASESFFEGRLRLIRPALMVEKKYMKQAARQWGLPVWPNRCPSNGNTRRSDMHELIERLAADGKHTKNKIFNAVRRYQLDLTLNNS
jgi:tRNA(Ile)-lysidine synthase TilS/MesJ